MTATCWSADEAQALLGVDAGPPDDVGDAAFLATHAPQRGRRLVGELSDLSAAINASSVGPLAGLLDELLADWPADKPIVWALGSPGTGKSHLVRLLSIQAKDRFGEDPSEALVFVPKSATSSIRRVLELVLAGQDGEDIRRLRDQIQHAGEGQSVAAAARKLLTELGYLVTEDLKGKDSTQRLKARGWGQDHVTVAVSMRELLSAGAVYDHAEDPSCFARTVADVRLGAVSAADRAKDDLEVVPASLPIHHLSNGQLAGAAATLASKLRSDVHLQQVACEILNQHLDRAVQRVFGIQQGLVTDAALEVRRHLAQQGKRLWLFFEDFAVLQGLQNELLDTFTAFDADLCELRVVAAMTPTPFRALPSMIFGRTVLTVDLDVEAAGSRDLREDLAARYLNAIRGGRELLSQQGAVLPNACTACPFGEDHRSACMDAFGTVEAEGIGEVSLFPFTDVMLERAMDRVNPGDGEQPFNPRFLITDVLRPVLRVRELAIREGSYPDQALVEGLVTPSDRLYLAPRKDLAEALGGAMDDTTKFVSPLPVARAAAIADLYGTRPLGAYTARISSMLDVPAFPGPSSKNPPTGHGGRDDEVIPAPPTREIPPHVANLELWSANLDEGGAKATLVGSTRSAIQQSIHRRSLGARQRASGGPGPAEVSQHFDRFRDFDIIVDRVGQASDPRIDLRERSVNALLRLAWDDAGLAPHASSERLRHELDAMLEEVGAFVDTNVVQKIVSDDHLRSLLAVLVAATAITTGATSTTLADLTHNVTRRPAHSGWAPVVELADQLRAEAVAALAAAAGIRVGTGAPLLDAALLEPLLSDAMLTGPITDAGEMIAPKLSEYLSDLRHRLADSATAVIQKQHADYCATVTQHLVGSPDELVGKVEEAFKALNVGRQLGVLDPDLYQWKQAVQFLSDLGPTDLRDLIRLAQADAELGPADSNTPLGLARLSAHELDGPGRSFLQRLVRWSQELVVVVGGSSSASGGTDASSMDVDQALAATIQHVRSLGDRISDV
jgi:hypothetical protein